MTVLTGERADRGSGSGVWPFEFIWTLLPPSLFSLFSSQIYLFSYLVSQSCPVSALPHPQTGNLMLNLILTHFSSGLEQLSYADRTASVNPIPKLISK